MQALARHEADALPFADLLLAEGYRDLCIRNGVVCGLYAFNFTTGLVVGLDESGYQRRYCYEHAHEARAALIAWNGDEHPGGLWIKCKGAGIDLLNPRFATDDPLK